MLMNTDADQKFFLSIHTVRSTMLQEFLRDHASMEKMEWMDNLSLIKSIKSACIEGFLKKLPAFPMRDGSGNL